jgi:hypothetical protein
VGNRFREEMGLGKKVGNRFREEMGLGKEVGKWVCKFWMCLCFFFFGGGGECVLNVVYYIILWVSFLYNWEIKKKVPKLSWAWPPPCFFHLLPQSSLTKLT